MVRERGCGGVLQHDEQAEEGEACILGAIIETGGVQLCSQEESRRNDTHYCHPVRQEVFLFPI